MGSIFVIQQVFILAILMAVGYIATKKNIINEEISSGFAKILTNIALPALIISSFTFTYSKDIIDKIAIMFIYSIAINIITIIMAKFAFKKYNKEKKSILKFGTIFPNSGFMGLPLILEFFGQEGLLYASIFTIAYHSLLWSYGDSLLSKDGEKFNLKKLMSNPPLVGIIIGIIIFLFKIKLPYIIEEPISMFSTLTLPMAMLILGEKLTKIDIKSSIKDMNLYYGCFIKLILAPVLAFIFLRILKADPLLTGIIVVMQALPTAVVLVVLTERHRGDVDFASKFTIMSHLLSIITIPLIIILSGIAN